MTPKEKEFADTLRRVIDRLHKRMHEPEDTKFRLPVHPSHISQAHATLCDHLAKLESGDGSVIDGDVVEELKQIETDEHNT